MKLLALDASTEACSVALMLDGELFEHYEVVHRQHTQRILPMVDALLSDAGVTLKQLDALACDRGPGSFTGVRISTSVVQGLAFAAELPVIPVSSLAALAQAAWRVEQASKVLSLIDARMNEVYWGYYQLDDKVMQLQGQEQVSAVNAIPLRAGQDWQLTGSGSVAYRDAVQAHTNFSLIANPELLYPRAQDIAWLAAQSAEQAVAAERVEAVYLRNKVTG